MQVFSKHRNKDRAKRLRSLARLTLVTTAGAAALLLLLGAALWFTTPLPGSQELRARLNPTSTRLLDRHGQLIAIIPVTDYGWHTPLSSEELPDNLRLATVAIEDATFFENPGVAPRALVRALWSNLRHGEIVSGGSTITQQLARGLLLDPKLAGQQTIERKLREAVLALKITRAYSKDDILTLYLNTVYYGNLTYGAEAAANRYFGKPARDLNLAEAALLAGLPQFPTAYDPLRHLDQARKRQGVVLAAMLRSGFISAEEAATAVREPLAIKAWALPRQAPHFVDFVLADLESQQVAQGGLVITTTLDLSIQRTAEDILRRQLVQLAALPGYATRAKSGAVIIIDPADGAILAMVGSPDYDDAAGAGQVNGATAPRQPGSAFKPLLYAAALEHGWTPASELLDIPSSFATREGRPYTPHNYDLRYYGPTSLRQALATSSNIVAVRLAEQLGLPAIVELAERLGIHTLRGPPEQYGLPLALGSGEVTLLELSAAYGAFANGGRLVTPYAVLAVSDASKTMHFERSTPEPSPQVLSPEVAYLMSDILSDHDARARAFGHLSALVLDRPAAVKTGTTTGWRDSWTIGYSPERVVGVWVGNADGTPMDGVRGLDGAAPVWHDVMMAIHSDLPPRPFPRPPGIVELEICAEGGLLPSLACPTTRRERFVVGSQPTRLDDTHILLAVDPVRRCWLSVEAAPGAALTAFRLLPPEAEGWAAGVGLPRPPAHACQGSLPMSSAAREPPILLQPHNGARFAIAPGVPLDRQRLALIAQASGDTSVTFIIDGVPLAQVTGPPYTTWWQLRPGTHRIVVEAKAPDGVQLRSPDVVITVLP